MFFPLNIKQLYLLRLINGWYNKYGKKYCMYGNIGDTVRYNIALKYILRLSGI